MGMTEQALDSMIHGDSQVPLDLEELVRKYRAYAAVRGECISFPQGMDRKMNELYDMMLECA